ncbi:MAG: TlpA family protein disulfide reductase [Sphingobacterium sp.]|jgi:thiol-disulfide isomerase/thioredoxin|nr:TlpA family protein disulfide reductase [Sphingobacterium sp.]
MKKIVISCVLICLLFPVVAQVQINSIKPRDYVIAKLGKHGHFTEVDGARIGETLRPFDFITPEGEKLTSDAMKGKVVLLDFWSTWCAPCRKLTEELDELFKDYHNRSDFQMIGVNYKEDVVKKEGLAEKYWKEKGYKFPMTVNDNVYGDSINAGNPAVFIVDQEGVLRAVRHAWSENKAEELYFIVWALLENPTIDRKDIETALDEGYKVKATYLLDQFIETYPDQTAEYAALKFRLLYQKDAREALVFIKRILDQDKEFRKLGKEIFDVQYIEWEKMNLKKEFQRGQIPINITEGIETWSREKLYDKLLERVGLQDDVRLFKNLASKYEESGDVAQARVYFQKAIVINQKQIEKLQSEVLSFEKKIQTYK